MYIQPKYANIEAEWEAYLVHANENIDTAKLQKQQLKTIASLDQRLQKLLRHFVCGDSIINADDLWMDDTDDNEESVLNSVKKIEEKSCAQLNKIICALCEHTVVQQVVTQFAEKMKLSLSNANAKPSPSIIDSILPIMATGSVKQKFLNFAKEIVQKALQKNKEEFMKNKNKKRMSVFMELCKTKMKMESVKKMKASNMKTNKDYGIAVGQPITFEHVLVLILYSQCTKLCTAFRVTYRRLKDESEEAQRERHAEFAHMARLLFEAFTFYGSTNSKVSLLYHGMSIELLFKNLECKFNAPTSTTYEEAVATSFGSGGIVMKLENGDANNKYIKTIDMQIFTCYDNEKEHFIYEQVSPVGSANILILQYVKHENFN